MGRVLQKHSAYRWTTLRKELAPDEEKFHLETDRAAGYILQPLSYLMVPAILLCLYTIIVPLITKNYLRSMIM